MWQKSKTMTGFKDKCVCVHEYLCAYAHVFWLPDLSFANYKI